MNRKLTWKQRMHSGFTLLEMMIAIAIIAILTAILVPTVNSYLTRSRLNTANSNAKVIFNSLQTIMQEYEFADRAPAPSALYGAAKTGTLFMYGNNGVLVVTSGGGALDPAVVGPSLASAPPTSIGSKLSRLYADYEAVSWNAYVKDYTVQGVVCAANTTTDYIGGYPVKANERGSVGAITGTVGGVTESTMITYCSGAWTPPAGP